MKLKEIINISREQVEVQLEDGTTIYLPERGRETDIDVTNISEIKGRVKMIHDLSEVNPSSGLKIQNESDQKPKEKMNLTEVRTSKKRGRKKKLNG